MSWLGTVLGGSIGFVLGGPIGAVLGAVIGHRASGTGSFGQLENRQGVYFAGVFSMLGKLAKADGVVTQDEIDAIDRIMRDNLRLAPPARELAINIFNAAKDSADPFEAYVDQFHQEFAESPEILTSIVELLWHVAYADGVLHREEEALIRTAARRFGIESHLDEMKSLYSGSVTDLSQCYAILGAEEDEALASIKKKYRRLAMEHHPDRLQSRGMPPEFISEAEDRFKEIQHAYDTVEKHLSVR